MHKIVRAETNDAPVIFGLAREIWRLHYAPIVGAAQVEYMLKNLHSLEKIRADISSGGLHYFLFLEDEKPAGYFAVKPEPESVYLSKLYVHPDFRKTGFARAAFTYIIDNYGRGKKYIHLMVHIRNYNSIAVYEKFGFKITETQTNDIGGGFINHDHIMRLDITPDMLRNTAL